MAMSVLGATASCSEVGRDDVLSEPGTPDAPSASTTGGDGNASSSETSASTSSSSTSGSTFSGEIKSWADVASKVRPSVVSIDVVGRTGSGQGSGVVLDGNGHILTNHHVAAAAGQARYQVATSDGRVYRDVELVGSDRSTDLAVLKINGDISDLKPIAMGDSEQVKPGHPVMALGNPLGLSDTVTTGIVSAVDRPVVESNNSGWEGVDPVVTNAIQTDAAINPGNSGGALVNDKGELIGINSSIYSLSGGNGGRAGSIGLGFAIPSKEVKRVSKELIDTGVATHAFLGVSTRSSASVQAEKPRLGAEVMQVVAGSPAAEAGLQEGDVITAIDGEPVRKADGLMAQVRDRAVGTSVKLTVNRDGADQTITATLAKRPSSGQ